MTWLQIVVFWFFTPCSHWRVYWHSAATSLSTYNAHSVSALKITVWITSTVKTWERIKIQLLTISYILIHNIRKYCKHAPVQNKMLFLQTEMQVLKTDEKGEKNAKNTRHNKCRQRHMRDVRFWQQFWWGYKSPGTWCYCWVNNYPGFLGMQYVHLQRQTVQVLITPSPWNAWSWKWRHYNPSECPDSLTQ